MRSVGLAVDYWHLNKDGKWAETVQQLATRYGLRNVDVIVKVREIAKAYDRSVQCARCFKHRELSSRSTFTKMYGTFHCSECTNTIKVERWAKQEEVKENARKVHESLLANFMSRSVVIDYGALDFIDAVLVYAIMLASDEACETGEFSDALGLNLTRTHELSAALIKRLYERNILLLSHATPAGSVQIQSDGSAQYQIHLAKWRFANDILGRDFTKIFSDLRAMLKESKRESNTLYEIENLWWLLAMDDLKGFLDEEIATYTFARGSVGPKTDEAFRFALSRLSVPQTRNQLHYVVGQAAQYSVKRGINGWQARNSIPKNFMQQVDFVLAKGSKLYEQLKDWQTETILWKVLFDSILETGHTGFRNTNGLTLQSGLEE